MMTHDELDWPPTGYQKLTMKPRPEYTETDD